MVPLTDRVIRNIGRAAALYVDLAQRFSERGGTYVLEERSKIMTLDEYLPAVLKKDGRSEQSIGERINKTPGDLSEIFVCKT